MNSATVKTWEPWFGKRYLDTKVLIVGESAYSWRGEDGEVVPLSASHPGAQLLHWISRFPEQRYFSCMTRALCRTQMPTAKAIKEAWSEYGYTLFVQDTVGLGASQRPSSRQFRDSKQHFLRLLEERHPLKIIVTGKHMWNSHMPGCNGPHLNDNLQSYELSDGALAWCLAVPHPSNRTEGFRWQEVGENIRQFKSLKLPSTR